MNILTPQTVLSALALVISIVSLIQSTRVRRQQVRAQLAERKAELLFTLAESIMMWQEFADVASRSEEVLSSVGLLSAHDREFLGTIKGENDSLKKKYAELEDLSPSVTLAQIEEKIGYARQMKMLVKRAHEKWEASDAKRNLDKIRSIGIGSPLAGTPSHTTDRTDRVISGSAASDRRIPEEPLRQSE